MVQFNDFGDQGSNIFKHSCKQRVDIIRKIVKIVDNRSEESSPLTNDNNKLLEEHDQIISKLEEKIAEQNDLIKQLDVDNNQLELVYENKKRQMVLQKGRQVEELQKEQST